MNPAQDLLDRMQLAQRLAGPRTGRQPGALLQAACLVLRERGLVATLVARRSILSYRGAGVSGSSPLDILAIQTADGPLDGYGHSDWQAIAQAWAERDMQRERPGQIMTWSLSELKPVGSPDPWLYTEDQVERALHFFRKRLALDDMKTMHRATAKATTDVAPRKPRL